MEDMCHGTATGADSIADYLVRKHFPKVRVHEYPAEWRTYGKAAGPIRNRRMLDDFHPEFVLAFANDIENSRGTFNMISLASDFKVPLKVLCPGCKKGDVLWFQGLRDVVSFRYWLC